MIRASVIGATGYAGEELTRLLYMHPEVEVVSLASKSYAGERFSDIYRNFKKRSDIVLEEPDLEKISSDSDVVFLALPHGLASFQVTPQILADTVIVDLGADFRLKDLKCYQSWYNTEHGGKNLLERAVYGLPELYREDIKKAQLIANPGCYPTATILSLAPLLKSGIVKTDSIIVDAASGVSGAGRSAKLENSYCSVDENYKAYGLISHRHTPEIEQELSNISKEKIVINFTPHLLPMQRGILTTSYLTLKEKLTEERVNTLYDEMYRDEYFIRYGSELPETKYVQGSNYVDIATRIDPRTNRIIVLSAIDNLIKGAAGQAVQNMNIRFGLPETTGIEIIADLPI